MLGYACLDGMTGIARVLEGIGDLGAAADEYRRLLQLDR